MSTWGEIARRCQEATGPDRDLDAEIACLVRGFEFHSSNPSGYSFLHRGMIHGTYFATRYTASVDAVLDLIKEKLPIALSEVLHGAWSALVEEFAWHVTFPKPEQVARYPLALLAAFSLAMEAEEASQGKEGERG